MFLYSHQPANIQRDLQNSPSFRAQLCTMGVCAQQLIHNLLPDRSITGWFASSSNTSYDGLFQAKLLSVKVSDIVLQAEFLMVGEI